MEGLKSLRHAVAEERKRKRLLGQYAVYWRDAQVVFEGPDASPRSYRDECRAASV